MLQLKDRGAPEQVQDIALDLGLMHVNVLVAFGMQMALLKLLLAAVIRVEPQVGDTAGGEL